MFNNLHQDKMNISKSYIIILLNSFVYGSLLDAVSAFREFYFEMNENRTSVLLFGCQINYVNGTLPSMPWIKTSTDWQLLIFDIQNNSKQNKFLIRHREHLKMLLDFFSSSFVFIWFSYPFLFIYFGHFSISQPSLFTFNIQRSF